MRPNMICGFLIVIRDRPAAVWAFVRAGECTRDRAVLPCAIDASASEQPDATVIELRGLAVPSYLISCAEPCRRELRFDPGRPERSIGALAFM
jgi:hypothetical protein